MSHALARAAPEPAIWAVAYDDLAGVHRTAIGAAVVRGLHLHRDGEPKVLVDDYALRLAGLTPEEAEAFVPQRFSTATWVGRARVAEDAAVDGLRRGIRQYVVLGAGLDSFALRRLDDLPELVVFEVDDPPLSGWKQERLAELAIGVPAQLRFVPCDFEAQAIGDALESAGFDRHSPATASWLGVTQYLTREAIDETLCWAASLASGSEIVLTYVLPGPLAEAEKARLARDGTRFETFFTSEEIADVVRAAGLEPEHVSPEILDARYFADRDDGLQASQTELIVVGHCV